MVESGVSYPETVAAGTYTVADAFLDTLAFAGVDYLFSVLGSDHASIIEAYVRRQNNSKKHDPKMILFLHEMVAISAADGYARLTGRPQCVLVHVDVGTAAMGQGVHNASSGRAPVLIFSGIAPYTFYGELPGSRSEHAQWYQDVPSQASIVSPYSRYTNEIKSPKQVQMVINRALLMASTGSPGPVYLTGSRETMAERTNPADIQQRALPNCVLGGIPESAVGNIGNCLLYAVRPLVVTGYLGRNHQAVMNLMELATMIGLEVLDSESRELSFPANHLSWITHSTGGADAVMKADIVLVLDADVPWIPTKSCPNPNARIFHIDLDPRKDRVNLFDIRAEMSYQADSGAALGQILTFIRSSKSFTTRQDVFTRRLEELRKSRKIRLESIEKLSMPSEDGALTKGFLFRKLREIVPSDTLFVTDAVTNSGPMTDQLQISSFGSIFSKGGSGLGWALGGAIGVKLASKLYSTEDRPKVSKNMQPTEGRFVCSITGDGSFMFGVPSAAYWASHRHNCPFLTIVINNGGWKATRNCLNDVHPQGYAAKTTDADLGIDLKLDGPEYCAIAKAAANGSMYTAKVTRNEHLESALKEAVHSVVEKGIGAIIDAVIVP